MKTSKIFGLLCLLILFSFSASAQKDYKKVADRAFSAHKYYQAIDMYKKAFPKEKSGEAKKEILYRVAECYRMKGDGKQAAVWYNKAIKARYNDANNPGIATLRLADIYKMQGNYEEALINYEKYKSENPSDKRGEQGIESCKLAKEWKDNPTRIVVTPMPLLNTEEFDFSPVFSDKKNVEIYFTSMRKGSQGTGLSDVTGMNFEDIYRSKRDKNGKWSQPVPLGEEINTTASEGSSSINKKRNMMYITRCGIQEGGIMGCSIFFSKKMGQKWAEPEVIPIAADSFTVGHPAISPDDKTLVFASNIPGGKGGKDLWYVTYDKKGRKWSEPTNMGPEINTPGDEMFPYIRENGELYFSSNGHIGMGGLDIFKAESKGVNSWGGVENLQSPINSEENDFGIIFDKNHYRGFFTTSRDGGKGGDDIWEFYEPPLVFSLEGVVTDVETKQTLSNAKVELIGTDGSSAQVMTDENGKFAFIENGTDRYIKKETSYSLLISKEGYLNAKGKETTIGIESSKRFFHEYALQPIKTEKGIKLPQILYEFAKADLLPQSKDSLNYLYNIMMDNPTIVVQLRSHTDYRGSDRANQSLSLRRAQSCVTYLVEEKGIPSDRIVAKGMGESEPLRMAGNILLDKAYIDALPTEEEREAAHQRNRRTDFKVLRTDYVPKAAN